MFAREENESSPHLNRRRWAPKKSQKAKMKIPPKNGSMPCGTTRLSSCNAHAGITAFVVGSALVFQPARAHKKPLFDLYLSSLIALVVFMASAIAAHWQQLHGTERLTFSGLFILRLYMLQRANQARLALRVRGRRLADRLYRSCWLYGHLFVRWVCHRQCHRSWCARLACCDCCSSWRRGWHSIHSERQKQRGARAKLSALADSIRG